MTVAIAAAVALTAGSKGLTTALEKNQGIHTPSQPALIITIPGLIPE